MCELVPAQDVSRVTSCEWTSHYIRFKTKRSSNPSDANTEEKEDTISETVCDS